LYYVDLNLFLSPYTFNFAFPPFGHKPQSRHNLCQRSMALVWPHAAPYPDVYAAANAEAVAGQAVDAALTADYMLQVDNIERASEASHHSGRITLSQAKALKKRCLAARRAYFNGLVPLLLRFQFFWWERSCSCFGGPASFVLQAPPSMRKPRLSTCLYTPRM
jgi:hypothetical protein